MPKMKTNSGAKKRFRYTATGKIRRAKSNHRHILTKKSPKRKRRLRQSDLIDSSDERRLKRLMPYGQK
ncbi:50S ribosomal protein L35 [Myxococcota bacterium]|nr:50S ribosomal protein L35 [Myxococcota bacterium]